MAGHLLLGTARSLISNISNVVQDLAQKLATEEAKVWEARGIIFDVLEENTRLKKLAGLSVEDGEVESTAPVVRRTASAIMITSCRRCNFLDLPGEIRNKIYHHAVVEDRPIATVVTAAYMHSLSAKVYGLKMQQPGILLVCCRLRQEALPIFYGENTFSFRPRVEVPATSDPWCQTARRQIKHMRSLALHGSMIYTQSGVKVSAQKSGEGNIDLHVARSHNVCIELADPFEGVAEVFEPLRGLSDCCQSLSSIDCPGGRCHPIGELLWEEMRSRAFPVYNREAGMRFT